MMRTAILASVLVAIAAAGAYASPPPRVLPGDAGTAGVDADRGTWIVGARDGRSAARLARRFGARRVGSAGAYVVARGRARAFARALRRERALSFAEPNITSHLQASGTDPFTAPARWRPMVVRDGLEPPDPSSPQTPQLALIDSKLDATHPEWVGGRVVTVGGGQVEDEHGTATASVAAAPTNGRGIEGIWPGMRATNFATDLSCSDIVRLIRRVTQERFAVLNMSYGSDRECFAESAELQRAFGTGLVLVAAAGNEFAEGNALQFPASLPHVLTVAATDLDGFSSYFSNANAAVDLSAPGERVVAAVPAAHDPDRDGNGYAFLDGTSFSAPMVAAAATWVRAARPSLSADQVNQVVRLSARDLDREGWDPHTGYGLLDVAAALEARAPRNDPHEPNEDIFWVNGRIFTNRDPVVYDGRPRRTSLRARLDQFEDPADVYRVRFPPRSRTRITTVPSFGDVDLAIFAGDARDTGGPAIGRSERSGRSRESVVIQNFSRSVRRGFVQTYINPAASGLDAAYALRFRRIR